MQRWTWKTLRATLLTEKNLFFEESLKLSTTIVGSYSCRIRTNISRFSLSYIFADRRRTREATSHKVIAFLTKYFFFPKCFLLRKQNDRGLMLPARSSFSVGCLRRAARSPKFSPSFICLLIKCKKKFIRSEASLYIPSYIDVYPYIRTYWCSFNLCVCNVKINTSRYS